MSRIFLCYRRSDSRWVAGRVYDRLIEVLRKENVFFDVSNIEPGEDFVKAIKRIVGSCDILLAIIGPNWLTVKDTLGRRRIENSNDLVRVEIATALRRNIRVIPILIDDAVMPDSSMLPEDLKRLTRRNPKEVSFNRFHADLDSLLRVLQTLLKSPETAEGKRSKSDSDKISVEADTISAANVHTTLPMTISLETLGGVATPLIKRGSALPAEESVIFSTAADNQPAVSIHLVWGEHSTAEANLSLGRFELVGIPPAPKGVPQIEILTKVNNELIMTVIAKDTATGRHDVLDSVDLSQIDIPDEMANELHEKPKVRESPRDAKRFGSFSDTFSDIFGKSSSVQGSKPALDLHRTIYITPSESKKGKEAQIENGAGKLLNFKIPAGFPNGKTLRLRGQGRKRFSKTGDLLVKVKVQDVR